MVGIRKPSASKSFKARTTGRVNRTVKRATNPLYGKKGTGFVTNPKRSVKNAVYKRTSVGGLSSINSSHSRRKTDDVDNMPVELAVDKGIWHWIGGIGMIIFAAFGGASLLGGVGAIIGGCFVGTIVLMFLLFGGDEK